MVGHEHFTLAEGETWTPRAQNDHAYCRLQSWGSSVLGYFLGLGLFTWGFRHLSPEPCASPTWLLALQATTGKEGTGGYEQHGPAAAHQQGQQAVPWRQAWSSSSPPRAPGLSVTLGERDTQDREARPLGLPHQASEPAPSLLTALSLGLNCQVQSAQLGHHPSGASNLPRGQTRLPTHRLRAHWLELQPAECEPRGASFNSDCLETSGLNVRALGVTVVLRPNFHKP